MGPIGFHSGPPCNELTYSASTNSTPFVLAAASRIPHVASVLWITDVILEDHGGPGMGRGVDAVLSGTALRPCEPSVDDQPDHRDEGDHGHADDDEHLTVFAGSAPTALLRLIMATLFLWQFAGG